MKKIVLFSTLLFSVTLFGQITTIEPLINLNKKIDNSNYDDGNSVYKWEAYTAKGALIFGVSPSKSNAEWVIEDFTKRNEDNAYKPIGFTIKKIETPSTNYVEKFKKKYPKGYNVLSHRNVIALRMAKVSSLNAAATFIESVTKKNNTEAFDYIFKLSNSFKTYGINK